MSNRLNKKLKRELSELKNNDPTCSKDEHYKAIFWLHVRDDWSHRAYLWWKEPTHGPPYYKCKYFICKASKKTKAQLINNKMSSVVGILEDYWLTSFANEDKTG